MNPAKLFVPLRIVSFLGSTAVSFLRHVNRTRAWDLQAIRVQPKERARLELRGVVDESVQRYAVWRRSLLFIATIPTLISAMLSTQNMIGAGFDELTVFGVVDTIAENLVRYVIPITAFLVALNWTRMRWSAHLLLLSWALTFLTPFLSAALPVAWWMQGNPTEQKFSFQVFFISWFAGLAFFVTMLPAVLSLLPALLRASLRIKTLLPASLIPGWLLVSVAPFHMLFWLVALLSLNYFTGNLLLLLGVLCWFVRTMIFVFRGHVFIRSLTTAEDYCRMRNIKRMVNVCVALAFVFLLLYLMTTKILGHTLVGVVPDNCFLTYVYKAEDPDQDLEKAFEKTTALFCIFDSYLLQFIVDWFGRTLFATVVFSDLLLRVTLSVWRREQQFHESAAAVAYGRSMDGVDQFLGHKPE